MGFVKSARLSGSWSVDRCSGRKCEAADALGLMECFEAYSILFYVFVGTLFTLLVPYFAFDYFRHRHWNGLLAEPGPDSYICSQAARDTGEFQSSLMWQKRKLTKPTDSQPVLTGRKHAI